MTGRPVEIHAYADRIVIRQDGRIVAEHPRSFGRRDTVYDPWHYVPVLARKPGALRNGASFKDWGLPAAMERVQRKLAGADDGNRQMVDILTAVLTDGLRAVEADCVEAITQGVHSADVVLTWLASAIPPRHRLRRRCDTRPSPIVPTTTTSEEPSDGTHSTLRPHGRAHASSFVPVPRPWELNILGILWPAYGPLEFRSIAFGTGCPYKEAVVNSSRAA